MDNPDVFRQIAYRLDDASLLSLPDSYELRSAVSSLLKQPSFWHQRVQYLSGIQIEYSRDDWMKIYYSLLAVKTQLDPSVTSIDIFEPLYDYAMESMMFFYVLSKTYKILDFRTRPLYDSRWRNVRSSFLLELLLDTNWITYRTVDAVEEALVAACMIGDAGMPKLIVEHAQKQGIDLPNWLLIRALEAALSVNSIDVAEYLSSLMDGGFEHVLESAVKYSAVQLIKSMKSRHSSTSQATRYALIGQGRRSTVESVLEVLEGVEMKLDDLQTVLWSMLRSGRVDVAEALLQKYPALHIDQEELVYLVRDRQAESVKFSLRYVSPVTKNNTLLQEAATSGLDVLTVLLQDERIDLTLDLDRVIVNTFRITSGSGTGLIRSVAGTIEKKRTKKIAEQVKKKPAMSVPYELMTKEAESVTQALVQYVDMRTVDTASIRLLAYGLSATIHDRVQGCILASGMSRGQVGQLLEGNDLYSATLRHIIFKRPTNAELCDWMIAEDEPHFQQAALCVLQSGLTRTVSIPYFVLLWCMLHPKTKLAQLLEDLQGQRDLVAAGQLVGAQLGYKVLLAQ
ncbi:Hypothetical protein POVR2_LOCUS21 [uncultured virus]|nr:Hypothetical protein POVR2_LOCUS21 [uncultured virus]